MVRINEIDCWDGYKKQGTKKGTGKNKGKRVNNCVKEDGRVVQGVNTTADVSVNQTKIEAAKFGNTVTKDGVPPILSKKIKGSNANVAFNLGLTENVGAFNEGYKLQLERDTGMMVLHIVDTATGKRTEVRGKSGYENNGYDANDKLHQLLDKIGKSANVSELINGEIVTINPKHPHGASAKTATDTAFNESLDTPYPYQWQKQDEDHYVAKADTPAGLMLIMFEWMQGDESWNIDFAVNGRMDKSGAGDEFSIFATVIAVIRDWLSKVDLSTVKLISFSADKSGDAGTSRTKLYTRFAKQIASQLGWRLEVNTRDTVDDFFKMHNPNAQVKENFANETK